MQKRRSSNITPLKPLGIKSYGSIPHLRGSRRGPADKGLNDKQSAIMTEKVRDGRDLVIVQEKLDGTNMAVAKIDGRIVALNREGYLASISPHENHRMFHDWVVENRDRFDRLLLDGERVCGEWLAQATGTRYALPHEPFVVFDIMEWHTRLQFAQTELRARVWGFTVPRLIHASNRAVGIDAVLNVLEPSGHGATDPVEGAVWRVERNREFEFIAKFVRHSKVDGCYLPDVSGGSAIWNWRPDQKLEIPSTEQLQPM